MFVYSKNIIAFINEIKSTVKKILSTEVRYKVAGDRFYNFEQTSSYPISIVIYNNKSMLGYFDPDFYELGFHQCLMHSSKEQLCNIIRHELAHYLTFIYYESYSIQPHGAEFRAFCQSQGWGEEVYSATFCLDGGHNPIDREESNVLRKIRKLMALTNSSNKNEAEQAMIKSQQLLMKHNIELESISSSDDEEKIVMKRVMKQKKEDAKMRAIAQILKTFFVNTVFSRGGGYTYLEISGSLVNLEIAEYVADFLQRELDKLWDEAKRKFIGLKGMVAKNSFLHGIAKGYCDKIKFLEREHTKDVANALMVIEKKLIDAKAMVYKRLSHSKSHGYYCQESSNLGESVGRRLTINPALYQSGKKSEACIGFASNH